MAPPIFSAGSRLALLTASSSNRGFVVWLMWLTCQSRVYVGFDFDVRCAFYVRLMCA
jgi:hypothetical protein